jgi:hypothetical protein
MLKAVTNELCVPEEKAGENRREHVAVEFQRRRVSHENPPPKRSLDGAPLGDLTGPAPEI